MNAISIWLGRAALFSIPVILLAALSGILGAADWKHLSSMCMWAAGWWVGYVVGKGWL